VTVVFVVGVDAGANEGDTIEANVGDGDDDMIGNGLPAADDNRDGDVNNDAAVVVAVAAAALTNDAAVLPDGDFPST
jgi:hypothetical protein